MNKNEKQILKELNKKTANELLDAKALLQAIDMLVDDYPANCLILMAKKLLKQIADGIEENRQILKIID